jgi:hypothetical protein
MTKKNIISGILLMNTILWIINAADAQIINGSFETESGEFSTEGWKNYGGIPHDEAPTGGGQWSLELSGGCCVNFCYQILLEMKDGEIWELRCWAKLINEISFGEMSWFIYPSKIYHKSIYVTDTIWTQFSIVDTFSLAQDDTVSVHLEAAGGIVGWGGAYFDLVETEKLGLVTSIENDKKNIPRSFVLYQNHPNPFNPMTTIRFDLPKPADVRLEVVNLLGQRISILMDRKLSAGNHTAVWNGKNNGGQEMASGLYLMKLTADNRTFTGKMFLIK